MAKKRKGKSGGVGGGAVDPERSRAMMGNKNAVGGIKKTSGNKTPNKKPSLPKKLSSPKVSASKVVTATLGASLSGLFHSKETGKKAVEKYKKYGKIPTLAYKASNTVGSLYNR